MNNKRFFKILNPDTNIYLWIIVVLVVIILNYNRYAGAVGVALLVYLIYYSLKSNYKRREKWKKYIENLSSEIDSAATYSLLNLPIPLTIIEFDGNILWYNSKFIDMIDEKDILDKNIENIIPTIEINKLLEEGNEEVRSIKIKDRVFKVYHSVVKLDSDEEERYIIMLYWIENTNFNNLKIKYNNER